MPSSRASELATRGREWGIGERDRDVERELEADGFGSKPRLRGTISRGMTRGTMLGRLLLIERRGLDGTLDSNATLLEGLDITAEDDKEIDPRLLGPLEDTVGVRRGETEDLQLPKVGTALSSSLSAASRTGESLNVSK